ncbi:MAG: hypothetical protein IT567_03995 [Alphaproteobacteria bacterium]|nr:hypothetical protein [Alphaproteobacteria bacterium]
MPETQTQKNWWDRHINLRERWKQATSPDMMERSTWLSGSSFVAAFLRWPALLVVNAALVSKGSDDKGGFRDRLRANLLDGSNMAISAVEALVFPVTLFIGSAATKFFSADVLLDERAIGAAENAIGKLRATTNDMPPDAKIAEVVVHSAEDYALHHSFIRNIQSGKFDAESVDLALHYIVDALNTGVERARADNTTRKAMGAEVICSKPLEHIAKRINGALESKQIYDGASHGDIRKGDLVHMVNGEPLRMSLEEKGELARSLLELLRPHLPLATDAEIMKAESRIRKVEIGSAPKVTAEELPPSRAVNFTNVEQERKIQREHASQQLTA